MAEQAFFIKLLLAPVTGLVLLVLLGVILRLERQPRWLWVIAAAGVSGFLIRVYVMASNGWATGCDFEVFWTGGKAVWDGCDPYSPSVPYKLPFYYPPNELPLFMAFGALPLAAGFWIWTVLNVILVLALVPLAWRMLSMQQAIAADLCVKKPEFSALSAREPLAAYFAAEDGPKHPRLSRPALGVLAVAVALSTSVALVLEVGQLSILMTAAMMAALHAQQCRRPILAGVCLAVASVKAATLLPFLLLFPRRADLPTWAALAVVTFGLCLVTQRPAELPSLLLALQERINHLCQPGELLGYTYESVASETIVSIDHALYRCGLRDPILIRWSQLAILATLGAWLAWRITWRRDVPLPAAWALVACYSVLFLYHRMYDLVMLVLPLTYVVGQAARLPRSRARLGFTAASLCLLIALYPSGSFFNMLLAHTYAWGTWGQLVQATVLPGVTWAILAAMLCIGWAVRQEKALGMRRTGATRMAIAPVPGPPIPSYP